MTSQIEALDALPDLTLAECCERWGVSRNAVKARAQALGIELRRESSTRTVWPAQDVPLGDELAEHLRQPGATLSNFPGAVPSVPAPAASTDSLARRSVVAPTASSDALAALAMGLQALQPAPQPFDPLAVVRGLAEAAETGAWLDTRELAALLRCSPGTVRGWADGHRPRPGFVLERRKDGGSVWWRVSASTD